MRKGLFAATMALTLASSIHLPAAGPEPVRTDAGLIAPAANSPEGIRVFRGIPFGAPPVGPLRWQPTQPPSHWDGVRKADAFGPVCVQPKGVGRLNVSVDMPDSPKADEDCLYLNVWTGATRANERRPVMVWIFGGAYTEGAGSSRHNDGEALARKGVVTVTFNYRLGPFGFFSHPELDKESGHNASGNQAVWDCDCGAQVGADEHRGVRRRPGERHDLRRVGRLGAVGRSGRHPGGEGPVPPGDFGKRRVDGPEHGADAHARVGRRRREPGAARSRWLRFRSANCARSRPRRSRRACAALG